MSAPQEVFQAIPLEEGPLASSEEATTPLIVPNGDEQDEEEARLARRRSIIEPPEFSRFKLTALLMGVFAGLFIQFSTLGANPLVSQIWGDNVASKTRQDMVTLSLTWSLLSSAMALVMLAFLRKTVAIAYTMALNKGSKAAAAAAAADGSGEPILHLECRFVVGALIGVCAAFVITDLVAGVQEQVIYSVVALALSLVWCKIVISCLESDEQQRNTEQSQQPQPETV